ncbi:MAG: TIGR00645 family protein, partial [Micrococcales bacterium]|nr:TIGR00645 family protein [Micrococcales bacterium]
MKKFQHFLEVFIFGARWLLAPLYIGLVGALALLLWRYGIEFVHLAEGINDS